MLLRNRVRVRSILRAAAISSAARFSKRDLAHLHQIHPHGIVDRDGGVADLRDFLVLCIRVFRPGICADHVLFQRGHVRVMSVIVSVIVASGGRYAMDELLRERRLCGETVCG